MAAAGITFDDKQELAAWLRRSGIEMSAWGAAGAKSLDDLWHEYQQGEIVFEDDPPARRVRVVEVIIKRGEARLLEIAQEFSDGRLRQRLQPPSEKLLAGERARTAAERCLREELDLELAGVQFESEQSPMSETVAESPSYPGLRTRYTIYSFEVQVPGLPSTDFWRDNSAAGSGDPVKRHLWGWRRAA